MIITDDRSALDAVVGDGDYTLFLLLGDEDSDAATIHECLEAGDWEDWHVWFLITDAAILTSEEWNFWFDDKPGDAWVVLGGEGNEPVEWGDVGELFLDDGSCDDMRLFELFALGDAGGEAD